MKKNFKQELKITLDYILVGLMYISIALAVVTGIPYLIYLCIVFLPAWGWLSMGILILIAGAYTVGRNIRDGFRTR